MRCPVVEQAGDICGSRALVAVRRIGIVDARNPHECLERVEQAASIEPRLRGRYPRFER